jgi:predicted enzyme related to lactoylglutathione lyase
MGSTATPARRSAPAIVDHVSWFEIPVYQLERAKAFYDHLYGIVMETSVAGDYCMAFFPASGGVGGALVQGPGCVPSDTGPLIYLNAGQDLDGMLERVEPGGGRVIMGRTLISEGAGWFALFIDSEGNRLALHQAAPEPAALTTRPRGAAKRADGRKPTRS